MESTTNSLQVGATEQLQLMPSSPTWDVFKCLAQTGARCATHLYAANRQPVELNMPITTRALLQRHYLLAVPVKVHIKSIPGWPTGTQPAHLPTQTLLHHRPHRGSRSSTPFSSKIWARGHTAQRPVSRRAAGDEAHICTALCRAARPVARGCTVCVMWSGQGVGRTSTATQFSSQTGREEAHQAWAACRTAGCGTYICCTAPSLGTPSRVHWALLAALGSKPPASCTCCLCLGRKQVAPAPDQAQGQQAWPTCPRMANLRLTLMRDGGMVGASFRLREEPSPKRCGVWIGLRAAATGVWVTPAARPHRSKPRAAVRSATSPLHLSLARWKRCEGWQVDGAPGRACTATGHGTEGIRLDRSHEAVGILQRRTLS